MAGKGSIDKRIAFLAERFNVFDNEECEVIEKGLEDDGFDIETITDPLTDTVIAHLGEKYRNEKSTKKIRKVTVEVSILGKMISADPTNNKMFVQWMLKTFSAFLKEHNITDAVRFACEDLPRAKEYLEVFEANKRKTNFRRFCNNNFNLKHISDCTNIDQYRTLSELFDAVDPFIEKDVSGLKRLLVSFVNNGDGEFTFKDRDFTVFVPKTRDAASAFHGFANWCTATPKNGMFKSYTDQKRPDGSNSLLYVIIPNGFFDGETDELYQLHFESNQFMDKRDGRANAITLFNQSDGLSDYFEDELFWLIGSKGMVDTTYKSWLFKFNLGYVMFNVMDENMINLRFKNDALGKVPDTISRFKNLNHLVATNCHIKDIHNNLGDLSELTLLSLNKNRIKKLPPTISKLKKLRFLSLVDNPIVHMGSEIADLDTSRGGSLVWVVVSTKELADQIKHYLPNAEINIMNKTKYAYEDL